MHIERQAGKEPDAHAIVAQAEDVQPAEGIGFFPVFPVYFARNPIAGCVDSELTVGGVFKFNLLKYSMKKYNNFQIDDGVFAQSRL